MRAAILGAGAMGSIFGAQFAESGVDTLLIDVSKPIVETFNSDGVLIRGKDGERRARVKATTDPAGEAPADVIIVFVKAWATDDAMKLAAPLIGEKTQFVSLQNGWGNGDQIARHVPAERVHLGVTYHSANVGEGGVINHTATGKSYIGPLQPASAPAAESIAQAFSEAGVETVAEADIAPRIWRKLMLNLAANPVAALTGLYSIELLRQPDVEKLMAGLAREAVEVANAEGQAFDADETIAYVQKSLRSAGRSVASMRQDVNVGRRTEIDVITGAIVRAADKHGIDVPLNRALLALVRGYEAALAQG
jgi:2-dehydropantoate 2-reductase